MEILLQFKGLIPREEFIRVLSEISLYSVIRATNIYEFLEQHIKST
jgi:hypothetical protein